MTTNQNSGFLNQSRRRYLFITGIARSGTTLLSNLLNAQPGISVWSDFNSGPMNVAQRFHGFNKPLNQQQRHIALSWLDFELQNIGRRSNLSVSDFNTVEQLYRLSLDELGSSEDQVIGHKLNGNGPHTALFEQLLQETNIHCICVLRDVRDVRLSQENHLYSQPGLLKTWNLYSQKLHKFKNHPRVVALRFEDFLLNPDKAIEPIRQLLDIDINTNIQHGQHRNFSTPWFENSAFHDVTKLFDHNPYQRWRKHLKDPIVRQADWFCKQELSRWHYEAFPENFSFHEIIQFSGTRMLRQSLAKLRQIEKKIRQLADLHLQQ